MVVVGRQGNLVLGQGLSCAGRAGAFQALFLSIDLSIECYLASLSKPERVVLDGTGAHRRVAAAQPTS